MKSWFSILLVVMVVAGTSAAPSRAATDPQQAKDFTTAAKYGALGTAGTKVAQEVAGVASKSCVKEALKRKALQTAAGTAAAEAFGEGAALWAGIATGLGWVVAIAGLTSALYGVWGNDPVDSHFMVIATPQARPAPAVPVVPGMTLAESGAIQALAANLEQLMSISAAYVTSVNRAQGASAAGNALWTKRQTSAAAQYALQLAALLDLQPGLRVGVRQAWQADMQHRGFPATVTFSNTATANGLSADAVQHLADLGAGSSTIAQIARLTSQGAAVASVSFPDILTDPRLAAANRLAVAALRTFAAAAAKGHGVAAARAGVFPAGYALPATVRQSAGSTGSADALGRFAGSATRALNKVAGALPLSNAPRAANRQATAHSRAAAAVRMPAAFATGSCIVPQPPAQPSAGPIPSDLKLYINGAFYPGSTQVITATVGSTLQLEARWTGPALEQTGGYWVRINKGMDGAGVTDCHTGSTCQATDSRAAPIHGRIYDAELHTPAGAWSPSNLVYVNWVSSQ